jgi:hypothetical protein
MRKIFWIGCRSFWDRPGLLGVFKSFLIKKEPNGCTGFSIQIDPPEVRLSGRKAQGEDASTAGQANNHGQGNL